MGWGSVVSTIGSVIGSLFGGNNSVCYIFPKQHGLLDANGNSSNLTNAVFTKDKMGRIYACNNSVNEDDGVVLSFPSRGDEMEGNSILIPGLRKVDITPVISGYAEKDNSEFEIAPCDTSEESSSNGTTGVQISGTGFNIPVDGKTVRGIGSMLSAVVYGGSDSDPATVKIGITSGGNLSGISAINVTGESDTSTKLMNIAGQSGQSITVTLPRTIKSSLVNVYVVAETGDVKQLKSAFQAKAASLGLQPLKLTEEEHKLLKEGKNFV